MIWSFTLTEYDPTKPWLILSTGRDSVDLADGEDFHMWATARWPPPRYRVKLDPQPFRWAATGE